MRNRRLNKHKKRIVIIPVTLLLTVSMVAGLFYMNAQQVEAKATLPGIETVVLNNNNADPFVILEVLPDRKDATLGYLVAGEEPIDEFGNSISNMPSVDERTAKMGAFSSDQIPNGLVGDDKAVTFSAYTEPATDTVSSNGIVYGTFEQVGVNAGHYAKNSDVELYTNVKETVTKAKEDSLTEDSINLYRKYVSYRNESGDGGYSISIKALDVTMPVKTKTSDANWNGAEDNSFNYQFFSIEPLTETANDGDLVFKKVGDVLTYQGTWPITLQQDGATTSTMSLSPSDDSVNNNEVTGQSVSDNTIQDNTSTTISANDVPLTNGIASVQSVSGNESIVSANRDMANTITDFTNLYIVHESQGSDIGNELYYITAVGAEGTGPFKAEISYSVVPRNESDVYGDEITQEDIDAGDYFVKNPLAEFVYKTLKNEGAKNDDGSAKYSFDYDFFADFTKPEVDNFSYTGGFHNAEWFKKYVFDLEDDQLADMVIDVVPLTMSELNSYDLSKADLIYFVGDDAESFPKNYDTDISGDLAKAIVNSVVTDNFPVIINRTAYNIAKCKVDADAATKPNLLKMLTCLMQEDLNELDVNQWDAFDMETLTASMKEPLEYENSTNELSYVNQSVFVNDDTRVGTIAKSDFNTKINLESKLAYGFSDLLSEIDSENFYLDLAGKTDRIAKEASKATAIRYIINYGDKRTISKEKLSILDLEPYDSEYYYPNNIKSDIGKNHTTVNEVVSDSIYINDGNISKDWITTNVASNLKDKEEDIEVDMMGTKEFIGKQNDLNADYDLIYIGMDTSIMNTEIRESESGRQRISTKQDNTLYNDLNMNNLVYSHMGDLISTSGEVNGSYRMSGNDITTDKLRALKEYVEAGYALILSDEFFNDNMTINTNKLDSSSNLYKFINEVVLKKNGDGSYTYFGKNINKKSNLESNAQNVMETRETFSKYLNVSKLVVSYGEDDIPLSYNEDGEQRYLQMNDAGDYMLDYTMTLKNDSAVEISATSYDVVLQLDLDADGKFEDIEKMAGLSVINTSTNSECGIGADGKYHILAGYTYHVSCKVPDGFVGFLAWKLSFAQNDRVFSEKDEDAIVRKAVTGFSAVPYTYPAPTIRVLQITSGNPNSSNNLDLTSSEMENLYTYVKDFNIEVDKITATDFVNQVNFAGKSYFEYLCDYNMIVLGFSDEYYFTGDSTTNCEQAILAIREYAVSGRSVLFTHDLNSFILNSSSDRTAWGYYANMYLRDIQGMDRYGNVKSSAVQSTLSEEKYAYDSVYDYANLKGNSQETVGFTDSNSMRYRNGTNYGINARAASYYIAAHEDYSYWRGNVSQSYYSNAYVEQVNEGQITQYPFLITNEASPSFMVSHTHPQYFQLNLDTDSQDANTNDDIVVWYTISNLSSGTDNYFTAVPKDVRNNYYIYNKGNVTYTGCGDSDFTTMEEKKLFVNTLVAAYNAGVHAPTVLYKESKWDNSANISGLCIPYDPEITVTTDSLNSQKVSVNFKTINNNVKNNKGPLYAKYYVEDTSGTVKIGNRNYREINPTIVQVVSDGTNLSTSPVSDAGTLSNFTIYTLQLTKEQLGLSTSFNDSVSNDNSVNLYIRLSTKPFNSSTTVSLSASESLNRLNIIYTELVDLE